MQTDPRPPDALAAELEQWADAIDAADTIEEAVCGDRPWPQWDERMALLRAAAAALRAREGVGEREQDRLATAATPDILSDMEALVQQYGHRAGTGDGLYITLRGILRLAREDAPRSTPTHEGGGE